MEDQPVSERTSIQWADSTWNPWIGCTKVSPGCAHCYAEALDFHRFSKIMGGGTVEKPIFHWGKGAPRWRTTADNWKSPRRWSNSDPGSFQQVTLKDGSIRRGSAPEMAALMIEDTEIHSIVFVLRRVFCSLQDWLDDEVPIEWLADFIQLILATPNLVWLLLTKRPENYLSRVSAALLNITQRKGEMIEEHKLFTADPHKYLLLPNAWLGTSVESAEYVTRCETLLKFAATRHFVSYEPALSLVDFTPYLGPDKISWLIIGGESGQWARPFEIHWARQAIEQCRQTGASPFLKQMGSHCIDPDLNIRIKFKEGKGGNWSEWPEPYRVREIPQ